MSESKKCCCPHPHPVECARIRHVKSFDDLTRSYEMEEADNFDSSDGCCCDCHEDDDDFEDYDDG